MFDWFKKGGKDMSENVVDFPTPKAVPKVPQFPPPKRHQEHYRVGFDEGSQMVTLTFIADGGNSMTLSMNPEACEKMIRMLRAAYPEEVEE